MKTNSDDRQAEVKNLDDIVFEERNRNYGAYYLRSSYNKNVARALTISVTAILLATLIPFIVLKRAHSTNINVEHVINFGPMHAPTGDVTPPPPPPPPPVEAIEQRVRCTRIEVTTDDVEDTQALNQDELGKSGNENPITTDEQEIKIEEKPHVVIDQVLPPYTPLQVYPSFFGGEEAMYKWLSENIKFPIPAREAGISGTVVVTFVVEKDGSITQVEPLNKIGGGCEEEAVRVVKLMPKWREGRQNNLPVRVQFNLPIKFSLEQ
jgi:protein TonB